MKGLEKVKQAVKWELLNSHKAADWPSSALENTHVREAHRNAGKHSHIHQQVQYTQCLCIAVWENYW